MKRLLFGLVCLTMAFSLQGCFWHSSSTERVVAQPSGQSTTVATSQPGTTTVVTNP
jgi:hypothetical protein